MGAAAGLDRRGSRARIQEAASVTPDQYRNHPSPALRRAFFRGGYARQSGVAIDSNPSREVRVTKKGRRGSWSEAFSLAWAVGWRNADRKASPAETTAVVI